MYQVDVTLVAWPNHPKRLEYARTTIQSLRQYLSPTCVYHCSAESTHDPKHEWCGDGLATLCDNEGVALHWRDGPPGLGDNMNAALRLGTAGYILLVQDDRPLLRPLDLRPSVDAMEADPSIDLIRYDWPPDVHFVTPTPWPRFDTHKGWHYGDEPHLRHRAFMDTWGWYIEDRLGGFAECDMFRRLRKGNADIRAADQRYFGHLAGCTAFLHGVDEHRMRDRATCIK